MRRVLHVVEATPCTPAARVRGGAASDQPALACAGAIHALPGDLHRVIVLGPPGAAAHAASLGLRVDVDLSPPLGQPALAWRGLRRAVRGLGPFDVFQPWSDGAVRACGWAGLPRRVIAGPPIGVSPAVSVTSGRSRAEIRASLGVGDAMPVVGLLADPAWLADARRFVYMIGLLDVAGIPVAGVVDPRTSHLARARRFHAEAAVSWRLLLPDAPLASVLHACDLAVVVPPAPHRELSPCDRAWARWSIARAHALGVPVIAGVEWLAGAAPVESMASLGAGGGALTEVARLLARLAEDADERATVSERVRAGAVSAADEGAFARDMSSLWDGGAGPDAVPALQGVA